METDLGSSNGLQTDALGRQMHQYLEKLVYLHPLVLHLCHIVLTILIDTISLI